MFSSLKQNFIDVKNIYTDFVGFETSFVERQLKYGFFQGIDFQKC